MKFLRKIAPVINKICEKIERAANAVCVFCLTTQTILICVLVIGRYVFNAVPAGTEELALLSMVWLAMLSMILCIRDDSHLKMELVDIFVSADKIKYFQVFAGAATIALAVCMIKFGFPLWKLRWGTKMATIKLSNAWYYAVIPLTGVLMAVEGFAFTLNSVIGILDDRTAEADKSGQAKMSFKESMAIKEAKEASEENREEDKI